MTGIQFTNLGEVLAGMEKRQQRLKDIPKLAKQMGVLATNEIHPLTHKKRGAATRLAAPLFALSGASVRRRRAPGCASLP